MLPTNVGASIGIEQLKKLDKLQAHRKMVWDYYQENLKLDWIVLPVGPESHETHSYFTFVISVKKDRDALAKFLLDNGVYTTLRYHPLHMNPLYCSDKVLPNSELLNEESLSIPIHANLTQENIEYVVSKIKEYGETN